MSNKDYTDLTFPDFWTQSNQSIADNNFVVKYFNYHIDTALKTVEILLPYEKESGKAHFDNKLDICYKVLLFKIDSDWHKQTRAFYPSGFANIPLDVLESDKFFCLERRLMELFPELFI